MTAALLITVAALAATWPAAALAIGVLIGRAIALGDHTPPTPTTPNEGGGPTPHASTRPSQRS